MPNVRLHWRPEEMSDIRLYSSLLVQTIASGSGEKSFFEDIWAHWVREHGVPVPPSCPPWMSPTAKIRAARSRLLCSLIFYGRNQGRIHGGREPQYVTDRIRALSEMVKYQETQYGPDMEDLIEQEDQDESEEIPGVMSAIDNALADTFGRENVFGEEYV